MNMLCQCANDERIGYIRKIPSKDVTEEAKLNHVNATKLHIEKALNVYEAIKSVCKTEEEFHVLPNQQRKLSILWTKILRPSKG